MGSGGRHVRVKALGTCRARGAQFCRELAGNSDRSVFLILRPEGRFLSVCGAEEG